MGILFSVVSDGIRLTVLGRVPVALNFRILN